MAEADYTPITTQMPNDLVNKIIQYGVQEKIVMRKRIYDERGEVWIQTVNLSATLAVITERFFEIQAQKVK